MIDFRVQTKIGRKIGLENGIWTVFRGDVHGANRISIAPNKCGLMIDFRKKKMKEKIFIQF